jgi:hypothetical protein
MIVCKKAIRKTHRSKGTKGKNYKNLDPAGVYPERMRRARMTIMMFQGNDDYDA